MLSKKLLQLVSKIPMLESRLSNIIGEEEMVLINNKLTQMEEELNNKADKGTTTDQDTINGLISTKINQRVSEIGENLIENSTGFELRQDIWDRVTGASFVPELTETGYSLDITQNTTGVKKCFSNRFKVFPNKKYFFKGQVYVGKGAKQVRISLLLSTVEDYKGTGKLNNTYYNHKIVLCESSTNGWVKVNKLITTQPEVKSGYILIEHLGSASSGTSSTVMVSSLMFARGEVEMPWKPHHNDSFSNPKRLVYDFEAKDKAEFTEKGFMYSCNGYNKPFPRVYYVGSSLIPKNPNIDGYHTITLPEYFRGKEFIVLPIMNGFDVGTTKHFISAFDVTRGSINNNIPNFQVKSWVRSVNKTTEAIDYEPHYLFYMVIG